MAKYFENQGDVIKRLQFLIVLILLLIVKADGQKCK